MRAPSPLNRNEAPAPRGGGGVVGGGGGEDFGNEAAAMLLDRDAPYLSAVMQYVQAGRIDNAFQCVFQFGNEKTLRSTMRLLDPTATWRQLRADIVGYFA